MASSMEWRCNLVLVAVCGGRCGCSWHQPSKARCGNETETGTTGKEERDVRQPCSPAGRARHGRTVRGACCCPSVFTPGPKCCRAPTDCRTDGWVGAWGAAELPTSKEAAGGQQQVMGAEVGLSSRRSRARSGLGDEPQEQPAAAAAGRRHPHQQAAPARQRLLPCPPGRR